MPCIAVHREVTGPPTSARRPAEIEIPYHGSDRSGRDAVERDLPRGAMGCYNAIPSSSLPR